MNEAQWLRSTAVMKMTLLVASRDRAARRKAGRRKLRLFGCFSCRLVWDQMTDPRSRHAVEVAERLADDRATTDEVRQAAKDAYSAFRAASRASRQPGDADWMAAGLAGFVLTGEWRTFTCRNQFYDSRASDATKTRFAARRGAQADALRCIFGNPFRSAEIDPAWRTWNEGTVARVAQGIYDDRAWDQMPILADALEDAGCTHEGLLAHCRGAGPHTRGCWVVDLLLGLA